MTRTAEERLTEHKPVVWTSYSTEAILILSHVIFSRNYKNNKLVHSVYNKGRPHYILLT